MQIRKMTLMLAALGAMSMVLAGCPDGGRESLECSTDADCDASEICHQGAKVCVQTCTTADDCPDSAKKCEALGGTGTQSAQLICKCSTPELCKQDERVSDASNLTCGQYSVCAPSGTTGPGPTTCSGEGQSTCAYGQFCSSGSCTAVPAPTCANFDPSKGGKTPVFNPATSTGPIIYDVTQVSFSQDSFCAGLTAKARVKAYTKTGTFPTQKSGLPGLFYVRVNGTEVDGTSLMLGDEYSTAEGGKRAEFIMNFCPEASATTLSIGLYFTGGNEICARLNRN